MIGGVVVVPQYGLRCRQGAGVGVTGVRGEQGGLGAGAVVGVLQEEEVAAVVAVAAVVRVLRGEWVVLGAGKEVQVGRVLRVMLGRGAGG